MTADHRADDVRHLLARIDALEGLLVCYRISSRPSEGLFKKLEQTKAQEQAIRARIDGCTGPSKEPR